MSLSLMQASCAVGEGDLKRWQTTENGPRRLWSVATHEKYDKPLRLKALDAIVNLRPRGGQNISLPVLVDGFHDKMDNEDKPGALTMLPDATRAEMIQALVPVLVEQMKVPPPQKKPDGTRDYDTSVAAKDAAFSILAHEPPLTNDKTVRDALSAAISNWAMADFENRLDAPQKFGIERMFKFIGPTSVRGLSPLLVESSMRIDRITALIAELGDPETKLKSSTQLVALAKSLDSAEWIKKKTPEVRDANQKAKLTVNPQQEADQLKKYQDQELLKVFSAMKKLGGKPTADYLVNFAAKKDNSDDRRKAALAALEGHVDRANTDHINKLNDIAIDEAASDGLKDLAFSRLGELPKADVQARMYRHFDNKKWKIRWVAAGLVLKSMTTKGVPEFMSRLPRGGKMAMNEFFTYGAQIKSMDAPAGEPKATDVIKPYLEGRDAVPKLVALGFYYTGKKADAPLVQRVADDNSPVPKCDKDDECNWQCEIPKAGTPNETEPKEIKTVGDFAKFCVLPSMK
ncbi:MAG: hypothetical protein KBF88_08420 [Polyangiaceae bacterium]|nr:hypothetical protein [Polyangiaceae bacterium]